MTVFNKDTDLPANINSVEKLAAWASSVLTFLYPNQTAIEQSGGADRVTQLGVYYITASDPPVWRMITRLSVELDPNFQKGGKDWTFVRDLGTASIPPEFKS